MQIAEQQFITLFNASSRRGSFSDTALGLIYEYLNEGFADCEFDEVAICCEFVEHENLKDFLEYYDLPASIESFDALSELDDVNIIGHDRVTGIICTTY